MYNWIHTVAVLVQVLSAIGVIILVLLQHGKGADMGAAFGSGASGSLFGATGSANFLSRTTGVLAAVFLGSTLALAYLSNDAPRGSESLMQGGVPGSPADQIPTTPTPGATPADASIPSVPQAAPGSAPSGTAPVPAATPATGDKSVPSVPAVPDASSLPSPSTPSSAGKPGANGESVPSTSGNGSNPK